MTDRFFERLDYSGDLAQPLEDICLAFGLGDYTSHQSILLGYEDFNARLDTSDAAFFVKFFTKERTNSECERYERVIRAAIDAGVSHPKLHYAQDKAIYSPDGTNLRVVVMDWLETTHNFVDENPTDEALREIVHQAALVNQIKINLSESDFVYDSWAITSFPQEFEKWQHVFSAEDRELVVPALSEYQSLEIDKLPRAFVHGDLIRTNVMQTNEGIYVFDFSVSNINPRIQELAVLLCDLFFDPRSETETNRLYNLLLYEYQKYITLTDEELKVLPTFVKAAHAMHVLGGARGEQQGDGGKENDLWWNIGRAGLKMTLDKAKK